jgi:hypothetical protein
MNRAESYRGYRQSERTMAMKDVETWLGNSLALVLVGLAIASGVIGLLVAFGYINEDATDPFQDGMVWMVGGLILAICANAFRREHHVVDPDEYAGRRALSGRSFEEGRAYTASEPVDEPARGTTRPYEEGRRR